MKRRQHELGMRQLGARRRSDDLPRIERRVDLARAIEPRKAEIFDAAVSEVMRRVLERRGQIGLRGPKRARDELEILVAVERVDEIEDRLSLLLIERLAAVAVLVIFVVKTRSDDEPFVGRLD